MRDDYLWDKSGEPDPEIERLEQLLGDLRYQRPRSELTLPQRAPDHARSIFRPALAIAAAVSFVMLAAGVWLQLGVRQGGAAAGIAAVNVQPGSAREWFSPDSLTAQTVIDETKQAAPGGMIEIAGRDDGGRRAVISRRREQSSGAPLANASLTRREERIKWDEGVAAREQLMKALHLASTKLNQVQKKIQDNKSSGPVS